MTLLDNIKDAVQDGDRVRLGYGRQPELVYVTQADGTKNPKPWVVAWPDAGNVFAATMRWTDGEDLTITFRQYGLTPESAKVADRRVKAACFAQLNTTVDGRRVFAVEQLTAVPLSREDEQDPATFVYVTEFRFRSTPA